MFTLSLVIGDGVSMFVKPLLTAMVPLAYYITPIQLDLSRMPER